MPAVLHVVSSDRSPSPAGRSVAARVAALLTALLLGLLVALPVAAQGSPPVRVLLDELAGAVVVSMPGPHRGSVDGRPSFRTPLGLDWPLRAVAGELWSDGEALGRSLTLRSDDGVVAWGGRRYRGALRVQADGDRLLVINLIGLEDYLRGVVPAEMQASWPLEALKAQAVAARTYTLSRLRAEASWDLCATRLCQVYRGIEVEHPRSDRALRETAGVVLTYGGEFARTYYHADSGGVLASSAEVWGTALPYLVSRGDVAAESPHRLWERRIEPSAVAGSLRSRGIDVGTPRELRVAASSESGRVTALTVVGSAGNARLAGPELRELIDAWNFKSTRFRMVGPFSARGEGWGHGVGMSQYGARALARGGYGYGQILAYYYPSTRLQRLPYAQAAAP